MTSRLQGIFIALIPFILIFLGIIGQFLVGFYLGYNESTLYDAQGMIYITYGLRVISFLGFISLFICLPFGLIKILKKTKNEHS